ncbi:MAG: hypothetical protein ACXWLJ_07230 [Rhizomicrobium sp.]
MGGGGAQWGTPGLGQRYAAGLPGVMPGGPSALDIGHLEITPAQ